MLLKFLYRIKAVRLIAAWKDKKGRKCWTEMLKSAEEKGSKESEGNV